MDTLFHDLNFAIRMLLKKPGFTVVALITLALGIGANTSIFSVVNTVLLQPLPYDHPEKIMQIWEANLRTGEKDSSISSYNITDWQQRNKSFDCIAAYKGSNLSLTGGDLAERIIGYSVSADFFKALGISAAIGRTFTADEDKPGNNHVVVLGYGLWQRRFGSDEKIVGQSIIVNTEKYNVIGVMPRDFQFPNSAEMWIPLAI